MLTKRSMLKLAGTAALMLTTSLAHAQDNPHHSTSPAM